MTKKRAQDQNTSFFSRVYAIVARIPKGRVVSYGQIARALASPRGARQVGWAMRACPEHLPWQRVVKSDGLIAGEGLYAQIRRARLEEEDVIFLADGRVDMQRCRWQIDDAQNASKQGEACDT